MRPYPSDTTKRQTLREYGKRYNLRTFVETGTFRGETVDFLKNDFDRLYSIELGDRLYEAAAQRFSANSHIRILHGDSAKLLPEVMTMLLEPALFWLDGHWSMGETARGPVDTPILSELETILKHTCHSHVVLIDDARMFGPDKAYPSIEKLYAFIRSFRSDINIEIQNDSIRLTPAGKTA